MEKLHIKETPASFCKEQNVNANITTTNHPCKSVVKHRQKHAQTVGVNECGLLVRFPHRLTRA